MIIDDTKIMAIELMASGVSITETAKKINKSRQAIYDWLKDSEFKAKLDERLRECKLQAEKMINSKLPEAVNKLWYLAQTAESEKVRADLLMYLVDRQLGKPTSKMDILVEANNNTVDEQDLLEDINEVEYEVEESDGGE